VKNKLFAASAVIAALAFGQQAQATETLPFFLSGAGISGSGSVSFKPDTIPGDPAGANNITGLTGTFSDSNVGVFDQAITGLVPTSPTFKPSGFATSLSYFPASDLPPATGGSLSYDNLIYPSDAGAPDTCFDGITGGFLDVFGALFTLANGDTVDLWSNGGGPNSSDIYGASVVDASDTALDYVSAGVTMSLPEPGSLWLLGTGLIGVLAWRRKAAPSRA
jgi:PEP-CTERM motif